MANHGWDFTPDGLLHEVERIEDSLLFLEEQEYNDQHHVLVVLLRLLREVEAHS
jgi:hypothetical protein